MWQYPLRLSDWAPPSAWSWQLQSELANPSGLGKEFELELEWMWELRWLLRSR